MSPNPRRLAVLMALMAASSVACHAADPVEDRVIPASPPGALAVAGDADLPTDPAVPSPETVLGDVVGTRPVRYLELKQYLHRLAESSDRVELREYGKTHEGRTLYYLVISDAANIRRLDDIRKGLASLADPRATTEDQARHLIETSPAVAWLSYTVHGDELSGTDAAVLTAYRLAAGRDEATAGLLRSLVVCIDPLQNPDGHERFLSMMQQLRGRVPSADTQSAEHAALWPGGRTNHYLFDMNRDWNMTLHPESRGRVAAIASWHPQLLVDAHEMGSTDTYLFSPPREPLNMNIPPSVLKWMDRFSADQATAFDRHGWSYYRGEWNEGWAIGFSDIWAKHHGAVGMLYEQAGSEGSLVRLPTEQQRHYAEDVAHQYVSTMANLATLARNRRDILADFHADKKHAVADARGQGGRDLFLFVPGPNRTRAAEFLATLRRQNIETFVSPGPVTLTDVVDHWGETTEKRIFPEGTVMVSMRQPLSPLARAMLEFDPRPSDEFLRTERRELELKGRSRFYDLSAWSVSMCFDVDAYWGHAADLPSSLERRPVTEQHLWRAPTARAGDEPDEPAYGYLIDGADDASIWCVGRLLQDGWKVRVGAKPFDASGRAYPAGTFLVRLHENDRSEADLVGQLRGLPQGLWSPVRTARAADGPDLGGRRFPLLQEPRIALAFGSPFSANSSGAIWHLLDARLGLSLSRLSASRLGYSDLRKYNVLILPSAWGNISRVLDDRMLKRLERWVEDGGTLIAVGRAAAALCKSEGGLGSVRLRRDVLEELDVYAEDARRQRSAPDPDVDVSQVWDFKIANGIPSTQPAHPKTEKVDTETLKRWDAWARRFMPRGAILRADLHAEHWLTHGCLVAGSTDGETAARVPVMYGTSNVLMAMRPVETLARLAEPESLRLGGLLWPEARRRLADAAFLTRERMGRGQVILFATDPVFRGYMHGTIRLFLNAVILGPGAGASAPMPW